MRESVAGMAVVDWIARFVGTVSTGGVVSTTLIWNEALPAFPDPSLALQVTTVVPSGNVEPGGGTHVAWSWPEPESVAVAGG